MTRSLLAWLAMAATLAALTYAVTGLPPTADSLRDEVASQMPRGSITNPVTGVLLDFRGYDTLLEVAVLLLVVVAVWALGPVRPAAPRSGRQPVLAALLRFLLPLLVLAGGSMLWVGATEPGGAFQGGALLGGALVLLGIGGFAGRRRGRNLSWVRPGLALGLTVFLSAGLATLFAGGRFLEYPEGSVSGWILAIESAALVSIGLTLGALFFGGRPTRREGKGAS